MYDDMMIQELNENDLEQVVGGYGSPSRGTNFLNFSQSIPRTSPPLPPLPPLLNTAPPATTTTTTTPADISVSFTKSLLTTTTSNQTQGTQVQTHNSSTAPGQTSSG